MQKHQSVIKSEVQFEGQSSDREREFITQNRVTFQDTELH